MTQKKAPSKEQVHSLATELKQEAKAGGGPMMAETAAQEVLTGGPIVDEIRRETAAGGGEITEALAGTGLENADKPALMEGMAGEPVTDETAADDEGLVLVDEEEEEEEEEGSEA